MIINSERHLLKHPFYQAWMQGTLSRNALIDYAEQYFYHVEAFPRYLQLAISGLHGRSALETEAQRILSENLAEEDGTTYGTSHPELWLRFAEGVGASRAAVTATSMRPGIRNVVDHFLTASQTSLPCALGTIYAYESQVPEVATSKIEGLKTNYQIYDARTLAFFEVHRTADVEHREHLLNLIRALPSDQQAEAQRASDIAAEVLWNFLTDICDHNGIACVTR